MFIPQNDRRVSQTKCEHSLCILAYPGRVGTHRHASLHRRLRYKIGKRTLLAAAGKVHNKHSQTVSCRLACFCSVRAFSCWRSFRSPGDASSRRLQGRPAQTRFWPIRRGGHSINSQNQDHRPPPTVLRGADGPIPSHRKAIRFGATSRPKRESTFDRHCGFAGCFPTRCRWP